MFYYIVIFNLSFHLLDLWLFHMFICLLSKLIALFYDHLNLNWFEFKAISLNSLVKRLYLPLCISNINLLFLWILYVFYCNNWNYLYQFDFFYQDGLFYFQVELLLNSLYNFQVFFLWHTFLCILLFYLLYHYHLLKDSTFFLLIQQMLSWFFHLIHLLLIQWLCSYLKYQI